MFAKNASFKKYLATFGFGALTGAALALLFAPMKGKSLQRKIGYTTDKVIGEVADKIEAVQESARRLAKA